MYFHMCTYVRTYVCIHILSIQHWHMYYITHIVCNC